MPGLAYAQATPLYTCHFRSLTLFVYAHAVSPRRYARKNVVLNDVRHPLASDGCFCYPGHVSRPSVALAPA